MLNAEPESARAAGWRPSPSLANPIIVTLLLLLVLLQLLSRPAAPDSARPWAGTPARIQELMFVARTLAGFQMGESPSLSGNAWDGAVQDILQAEKRNMPPKNENGLPHLGADKRLQCGGSSFGLPGGPFSETYQRALMAAYGGGGPVSKAQLETLRVPLGDGYAYRLLALRIAKSQGEAVVPLEKDKQVWATTRLSFLTLFSVVIVALVLAGLVGFFMQWNLPGLDIPTPIPSGLSWRGMLIVVLTWLLALRLSGTAAMLLLHPFGHAKYFVLPLATGLHSAIGIALIVWAEGRPLKALWEKVTRGPQGVAFFWTPLFLGMALCAVFLAVQLAAPFTRGLETPQKDIRDLVSGLEGLTPSLIVAVTIGMVAPCFEELFFRGFILSWIGEHLQRFFGRRFAWAFAILISGAVFGVIHFQPAAIPTLATLGIMLGWAFYRTQNLWTPILMHACWNGGAFLLMRVLG